MMVPIHPPEALVADHFGNHHRADGGRSGGAGAGDSREESTGYDRYNSKSSRKAAKDTVDKGAQPL